MPVSWVSRLGAALATAMVFHHLLALSLQSPPGPDEGMYLSAASLARDHPIYTGFSYLQAPYLPLVLAPATSALERTSPLLVGRAATFLHHVAALGLLFLVSRTYTRDSVFSLVFALSREARSRPWRCVLSTAPGPTCPGRRVTLPRAESATGWKASPGRR